MAEEDPIAASKARWSYIQPYLFAFMREQVGPLTAKPKFASPFSIALCFPGCFYHMGVIFVSM